MLAAHFSPFFSHVPAEDHYQFPVRSIAVETFEGGHEEGPVLKQAELLWQIAAVARSASCRHYNVDVLSGRCRWVGTGIGHDVWFWVDVSVGGKINPAGSREGEPAGALIQW